ncbi:MAG: hydrogenase expression protein HyaE [Burkholderiaceae bacterium]|nr:hydrogenase expression protein HyaE [Burkholderiaceae bacterium]
MNTITKSIAHIDTETHPCFVRLRDQAGFEILNEDNLEAFLDLEGLKMAVFADDPNARKETMDIVVIAPELKKAFGNTLSQGVLADFMVARAIAARWGLRSMPAVALFRNREFLGAVQGLQTWDDYCQKLVSIMQKPQSTPRVIALKSEAF